MVDFNVGDTIKLRGKTLKGKNRVREHGDTWVITIVADAEKARFGFIKEGELCIEPIDQQSGLPEGRWISPTNDPHFEILDKVA